MREQTMRWLDRIYRESVWTKQGELANCSNPSRSPAEQNRHSFFRRVDRQFRTNSARTLLSGRSAWYANDADEAVGGVWISRWKTPALSACTESVWVKPATLERDNFGGLGTPRWKRPCHSGKAGGPAPVSVTRQRPAARKYIRIRRNFVLKRDGGKRTAWDSTPRNASASKMATSISAESDDWKAKPRRSSSPGTQGYADFHLRLRRRNFGFLSWKVEKDAKAKTA